MTCELIHNASDVARWPFLTSNESNSGCALLTRLAIRFKCRLSALVFISVGYMDPSMKLDVGKHSGSIARCIQWLRRRKKFHQ